MEVLFVRIINMSLAASIAILAVLLLRMVLRRVPKHFSYALWGVVLFRLLCPVSFSSDVSIYNLLGEVPVEQGQMEYIRYANEEETWQELSGMDGSSLSQGVPGVDRNGLSQGVPEVDENGLSQGVSGVDENGLPQGMSGADENGLPQGMSGADTNGLHQGVTGVDRNLAPQAVRVTIANQASALWLNAKAIPANWIKAGTAVWLSGTLILLLYSIVSARKLQKQLKSAVHEEGNVYRTNLATPFVYGMFKPKIYLPAGIEGREKEYILLHERIHIKRGDYLVKILSFLVLCIHWFNPLVWAAFIFSEKDMEMSCDEAVIRKLGSGMKKEYSASLLALATDRRLVRGVPLAFGEGDTGSRIRNVLRYKKPATITLIIAVICCAIGVLVLTANPSGEDAEITADTNGAGAVDDISNVGNTNNNSTVPEGELTVGISDFEMETPVLPTEAIQNREYGMYLSEYRADVTHDGIEDAIGIYISNIEGRAEEDDYRELLDAHEYATVAVYDGKDITEDCEPIHTVSFAKAHAGNGNLAVISYEGQDCLMYYFNSIYQGIGDYGYEIYYLFDKGEKVILASDTVRYRVDLVDAEGVEKPESIADKMPDFSEYCNAYQLEQMEIKLNELLADARVLAAAESDAENCYLYRSTGGLKQEPVEAFEQSAFDVFAAEAGRGGQESIREYCQQWQQEFENNWLWYKTILDPGYQEVLDIWNTVYPLYQQLAELEWGVECEQETVELAGLSGSYLKVEDERYTSEEDIRTVIAASCTGIQASYWENNLLDTKFYVEQNGVLYHLMADTVTTPFSRNIVDYKKVSDTELQLMLEVKEPVDGLNYAAVLKLQKEDGLWKMADFALEELITIIDL